MEQALEKNMHCYLHGLGKKHVLLSLRTRNKIYHDGMDSHTRIECDMYNCQLWHYYTYGYVCIVTARIHEQNICKYANYFFPPTT